MPALSPELLRSRRVFDRTVLFAMAGSTLNVEGFRNVEELVRGAPPIARDGSAVALAYRLQIHQPTLVGPDTWAQTTTIAINTDVPNYPFDEPVVWALNPPYPWSPHWSRSDGRFCIGELWSGYQGKALLGDLVRHIAMMLNWDEDLSARGPGYVGWNSAAVSLYWARGGKPLIDGQSYPNVPADLVHGRTHSAFRIRSSSSDSTSFRWATS